MQEQSGFTARSGHTVKIDERGALKFDGGNGYLGPFVVADAADYFLAAHDESRGRWRWPEGDHMLVYPIEEFETLDMVKVLDERTLTIAVYDRDNFPTSTPIEEHRSAARAYFDAHPPKQSRPSVEEIVEALRATSMGDFVSGELATLASDAADVIEALRRGDL